MPSTVLRPGRPTVYLDTSTLSDAFRGSEPHASATHRDLFALVERTAHECNLCLSTMHIAELAQGDESIARGTIAWLDSLPLVWTYSYDKVGDSEDEHVLQRVVGAEPYTPVEVFAPSMLAAFKANLTPKALSVALGSGSPLRALAEATRTKADEEVRAQGQRKEHRLIVDMVRRFHRDRHLDPSTRGLTAAEKAAIVARKKREELVREAQRAWGRLRECTANLREFVAKYRAHENPNEAFADFIVANPTSVPSFYVAEAFGARFAEVMAGRDWRSKRTKKLGSSFYDYVHLGIGAAYCDVFTCDELTSQCLRDAPEHVGRRRPIVFTGGDDGASRFVHELKVAIGA